MAQLHVPVRVNHIKHHYKYLVGVAKVFNVDIDSRFYEKHAGDRADCNALVGVLNNSKLYLSCDDSELEVKYTALRALLRASKNNTNVPPFSEVTDTVKCIYRLRCELMDSLNLFVDVDFRGETSEAMFETMLKSSTYSTLERLATVYAGEMVSDAFSAYKVYDSNNCEATESGVRIMYNCYDFAKRTFILLFGDTEDLSVDLSGSLNEQMEILVNKFVYIMLYIERGGRD